MLLNIKKTPTRFIRRLQQVSRSAGESQHSVVRPTQSFHLCICTKPGENQSQNRACATSAGTPKMTKDSVVDHRTKVHSTWNRFPQAWQQPLRNHISAAAVLMKQSKVRWCPCIFGWNTSHKMAIWQYCVGYSWVFSHFTGLELKRYCMMYDPTSQKQSQTSWLFRKA